MVLGSLTLCRPKILVNPAEMFPKNYAHVWTFFQVDMWCVAVQETDVDDDEMQCILANLIYEASLLLLIIVVF